MAIAHRHQETGHQRCIWRSGIDDAGLGGKASLYFLGGPIEHLSQRDVSVAFSIGSRLVKNVFVEEVVHRLGDGPLLVRLAKRAPLSDPRNQEDRHQKRRHAEDTSAAAAEFLEAIDGARRAGLDGLVAQVAFEIPLELAHGSVASLSIGFERAQDDPVELAA